MDHNVESSHFARLDVFERWAWLYALCRERIFSDHTELIVSYMRERCCDVSEPLFLELGCGPGFYSASLARTFPNWRVVGVDRSARLIQRARRRAEAPRTSNCSFVLADVTKLSPRSEADFILASRLLLILTDRGCALQAIYASLKPGGILLIAEPLAGWRTAFALGAMRLLHKVGGGSHDALRYATGSVGFEELNSLLERQPWSEVLRWSKGHYQFALCVRDNVVGTEEEEAVEARGQTESYARV